MATTTTNFGWDIPQSTDLVKDGATAIAALGQDIDTALVDLKGGTTGQILAKASNTDLDYSWITNDVGDITAVTAGTGITGGGTSGAVTVSFDQANFGGGQFAAGKNKIINGSLEIWQRGTSFIGSGYAADRWYYASGGAGRTWSRQAPSLTGFQYCIRSQRDSGNTATNSYSLRQNLETVNSLPFAGQTVTISFYARAGANYSAASNGLVAQLKSGTGTDQNSATSYTGEVNVINETATLTTSWQRFSYSGTVGSSANELSLVFIAIPTGTAGAADYFDVTGVMLEVGSQASPYANQGASIQGELAMCQRYLPAIPASNGEIFTGQCYSSTAALIPVIFPVTARVAPTGITVNSAGNFRVRSSTASKLTTTAINFSTGTVIGSTIEAVVSTGLTAGNATNLFNESAGTILFTGCEL
jgi:hypothetical protein